MAPRKRPPAQQHAATAPALRGPTRSSQPPQIAAETPSRTKKSVNIQPMLAMRQSQVVVKISCKNVMSGHALGCVIPSARDNGSQNTEKPYAMPMHKWMQSAAGGTSQRLNPALAIVRSRSRSRPAGPMRLPACSIVVTLSSLGSLLSRGYSILLFGCVVLLLAREAFARRARPRIEPAAAVLKMGEDRGPHPRVPVFPDVIGRAGGRLLRSLGDEELADLIGHVDELVRRHGRQSLSRSPSRSAADA